MPQLQKVNAKKTVRKSVPKDWMVYDKMVGLVSEEMARVWEMPQEDKRRRTLPLPPVRNRKG